MINLPFQNYASGYEQAWDLISNSEFVSEELRAFLEYRDSIKEKWVKCFMKHTFTCGTCTSSRIESKHRIYKTYLNGESRLCEIFKVFKELEQKQIESYQDEVKKLTKSQELEVSKHVLVQEVEKTYSAYVVKKIKEIVFESIHYSIEETKKGQRW